MCGRLFQSFGSSNCPECAEELDKAFIKIKEYIYDHEKATIVDVVEATGVPEKFVLQCLKEGRLIIEGAEILKCENCGCSISSGRYCDYCRDKLADVLSSVVENKKKSDVAPKKSRTLAKMHGRYGRNI